MTDRARTPLELVRGVYATHEQHDTPGLLELLDDGIVWETAENHPYAGDRPWRGHRESAEHVFDPINHDWDDYVTEVDEIIDAGDRIIVTARYKGTYRATGRPLDAQVCVIYTVRDGKIVRFQQFTDTAQFRAVIGVDG
jgi:ketosteroid isomerase-like protein